MVRDPRHFGSDGDYAVFLKLVGQISVNSKISVEGEGHTERSGSRLIITDGSGWPG